MQLRNLDLISKFSLNALAALAGLVLAFAEGSPLAALTVPLAILTAYFVDWKKAFEPAPALTTGLGFLAFFVAAVEFFTGGIEARLLAGGHLLVYLTWILLIQPKENRRPGWLLSLSALQIAVASLLTNEIWFGGSLMAFVFLGNWTLTAFLLAPSVSQSPDSQSQSVDETLPPRRLRRGIGQVWSSVADDGSVMSPRFVGSTLAVTCMSLAMSTAFFLFIPRVWIVPYSIYQDSDDDAPLTGFTDEVRLGEIGEILENDDLVMTLRLYNNSGDAPFAAADYGRYFGAEPLFRGAVLVNYRDGKWERLGFSDSIEPTPPVTADAVKMHVTLQPIGSPTLFAFGDPIQVSDLQRGGGVRREPLSNEFVRTYTGNARIPYNYIVVANRAEPDTSYSQMRRRPQFNQLALRDYLDYLTTVPSNLERVREIANTVVQGKRTPMESAQAIENWLQNSGEFSYTLKMGAVDASIDPLEDFLINRKEGHCEYFASAMTMMLRSVGIPARLISGFKGGVYSRRSNTYHVQQLHAHAWTEAYIDGQWRTFDPTPAMRNESVQQMQRNPDGFAAFTSAAKERWSKAIGMSRDNQQREIYRPLADTFQNAWKFAEGIFSGERYGPGGLISFLKSPGRWFSLEGAFIASLVMLLLATVGWLLYRLFPGLRNSLWRWQRRVSVTRRHRSVVFYERLKKILKRQGISQTPSQTAREFLQQSLTALQSRIPTTDHGMASWKDDFVEQFYRVRFGEAELSPAEYDLMDQRLDELEEKLRRGTARSYGR